MSEKYTIQLVAGRVVNFFYYLMMQYRKNIHRKDGNVLYFLDGFYYDSRVTGAENDRRGQWKAIQYVIYVYAVGF